MTRAAARLLTRRIVGAGTARLVEDPASVIFEVCGIYIRVLCHLRAPPKQA